MQALRFSNDDDRRGRRAGRAAPALPRLRLRGVDRLGGTPLRARRRRPAGAAARADPGRLHHPQQAQGRPAAPYLRRPRGSGSRGSPSRRSCASIRPDLDGNQIMEILGVGPGREVGAAYQFLLELRMDNGPMSYDAARDALLAWHASALTDADPRCTTLRHWYVERSVS